MIMMIIAIINEELKDYIFMNHICTNFINKKQFKKYLLSINNEIYFINVNDETWNEFKTKNSKRLELNLDELNKLIQKASYVFLIKKNYIESCIYYPKND
jgi:hypothetical protein